MKQIQKGKKRGHQKEDLSEKGLVEKNYRDYSLNRRLALDVQSLIGYGGLAKLQKSTVHLLRSENIRYIYQLAQKTESDLLRIKAVGRKKLWEIKHALRDVDLCLGMEFDPEILAKIESKIPLQDRLPAPPKPSKHITIIVETDLTEEKIKKLSSKAKDQVEGLSAVVRPSAMSAISAFIDIFNKTILLRSSPAEVSSASESEKK